MPTATARSHSGWWDDQHNLVVDELTVAPGEEVSLKTLERNTDYQVEMQTEAEFACLRFH